MNDFPTTLSLKLFTQRKLIADLLDRSKILHKKRQVRIVEPSTGTYRNLGLDVHYLELVGKRIVATGRLPIRDN